MICHTNNAQMRCFIDGLILKSINGNDVENGPFDDIVYSMKNCRPPHRAIFLRYDFRYDPFNGTWQSLQELRDIGVCVEDPMITV